MAFRALKFLLIFITVCCSEERCRSQIVRATDTAGTIVLDNGLVGLTWEKSINRAISLRAHEGNREIEIGQGAKTLYFNINDHQEKEEESEYLLPFNAGACQLVD